MSCIYRRLITSDVDNLHGMHFKSTALIICNKFAKVSHYVEN